MIRRAVRLAMVGALAAIAQHILSSWGEYSFPVKQLLCRAIPAAALWLLFRELIQGSAWIRLVGLWIAFSMSTLASWVIVRMQFIFQPTEFRAYAISGALLMIEAITIPLVLGTISWLRSTVRIGSALLIVFMFHCAIMGFTDVMNLTSALTWYVLAINVLYGGSLFAALAPDHIAMERAALARKMLPICEKCEYDLTGNVSGVCPECGTALSEALRQRIYTRSLKTSS